MTDLENTLNHLLAALERGGSPMAPLLQPGLAVEQISELAGDLPVPLPDELVALYGWRNGVAGDGASEQELFPGGFWLPFEEALAMRQQALLTAETVAADAGLEPGMLWDPSWLPVFVDFAASTFVVACEQPAASPVWFIAGDDPDDRHLEYASIGALARTVAEAWDAGVFAVRGWGVEADEARFAAIRRQHNPAASA